jgi:hypothetical protein
MFAYPRIGDDYDRLLQTCLREFEREVVRQVEAEFARVLAKGAQPDEEIPFIGDPFPSPQYRDGLQARVVRALLARKWFEFEAPLWAQPLPLTEDDCMRLINQPNRRLWPICEYGRTLRGMGWDLRYAPPFEQFLAEALAS